MVAVKMQDAGQAVTHTPVRVREHHSGRLTSSSRRYTTTGPHNRLSSMYITHRFRSVTLCLIVRR